MELPAPDRLSATTFWPHISPSFCASMRARMSVEVPAGNPINMCTGLVGKFCANDDIATSDSSAAAILTGNFMDGSPNDCYLLQPITQLHVLRLEFDARRFRLQEQQ